MKKKIVLLCTALITLSAFAAITGCSTRDDDYYFYGNITFWNDDPGLSDIIVTVDNSQSATINKYTIPSYCNSAGYANFYLIEGNHIYRSRTVNGTILRSGSFYVDRDCDFIYVD